MLIIGLMSGTSVDGVDACLIEVDETKNPTKFTEKCFIFDPYKDSLKEKILDASNIESSNVQKICSLNFELGYVYVSSIEKLLTMANVSIDDVTLIAMHGQTIWHNPNQKDGYFSSTLQIGEPSIIAYHFNKLVISNFRTMDMAAGGNGAPLVPFVNYIINKSTQKNVILQNIGGISNLTYIPKNGKKDDVLAFDTGPGNMLIDRAMKILYNLNYDNNGQIALSGKVNKEVLKILMQDEYLSKPLPKSTGREKYDQVFLDHIFTLMKNEKKEDIIATITAYTADTIVDAYKRYCGEIDIIILSGGGAYNQFIVNRIKEKTNKKVIISKMSDSYEAFCFGILGYYTYNHKSSNMKYITGAMENVVLGNFTYPPKEEQYE